MASITTMQLSPDQKPFINIGDKRAVELFAEAMSQQLTEKLQSGDTEFLRICHEYANGRGCVFLYMHTEPAARIRKGH